VTPSRPSGLRIRSAQDVDLGRLVHLLELGALAGGKEQPTDLRPYAAALSEIGRGPGDVLVAEMHAEVVGLCQLIVFRHLQAGGGRCAEIESVHVHPDHRGRGIGRRLMEEAIGRARAAGCYRVQLTSNLARPEAHRFYLALGFEASHRGFKLALP